MEAIVEELIAVISKEIDAFNRLLETLHAKQRAIVEGQIEQLNGHVEDETRLADETKSLENERLASSQKLARELEMTNVNPRLSEIIGQVEERYAKRLGEQRDLLRNLVQRIQIMNQNNQFLLDHSLKFIEKSMAVLLSSQEQGKVYKKDGGVNPGLRESKMLDQTI